MKRRSFLGCGVVAKRYRGFALLVVTRPIRWSASIDASWGLSAGLVGVTWHRDDDGVPGVGVGVGLLSLAASFERHRPPATWPTDQGEGA